LVVKNGSKIFSRVSSSMPGPVSEIVSTINVSPVRESGSTALARGMRHLDAQ